MDSSHLPPYTALKTLPRLLERHAPQTLFPPSSPITPPPAFLTNPPVLHRPKIVVGRQYFVRYALWLSLCDQKVQLVYARGALSPLSVHHCEGLTDLLSTSSVYCV